VTLDVNGTVYKDDILLPAVAAAARTLTGKLAKYGLESNQKTTTLALGIGVTSLHATSTPPLPTDFVAPQRLREKITSSTDKFVDMENVGRLSDVDQVETLREWTFQDGKILLIGATVPVTIELEYLRSILPITSSGSSIDSVPNCCNFLAYQGLVVVGSGRGDADMIQLYGGLAQAALDDIIDAYETAGQYSPVRRAPYGPREDDE
jgi:hypothetical protein